MAEQGEEEEEKKEAEEEESTWWRKRPDVCVPSEYMSKEVQMLA